MSSYGMTYEEAIDAMVSAAEARAEIERHDGDTVCSNDHCVPGTDHGTAWQAFICDNGDHNTYVGADVLTWLGY